MSEVTDGHDLNGTYEEEPEDLSNFDVGGEVEAGQFGQGDDEDEESDDYDDNDVDYEEERQIVGDEDEDEDGGEEDGQDGNAQDRGTLTHLLISNSNAQAGAEDLGDEDEEDEEDDDEDYVEEPEEPEAQDEVPVVITSNANAKKRPIDEVADEDEDTQGAKKVKA